jgi:hypothetical protein
MKKRKYTAAYGDESRLFYVALLSCFLVVSAYMYFVSLSVVNVVMRKEVDGEIRELTTGVGELEAEYIEKQHAVSGNIATAKGFVTAEKKIFIDKAVDTLVLSRN